MNDFHAIIFAAIAIAVIAVPIAFYFIFRELRAIRKMLQARQAYDWNEIWYKWELSNKPRKRPTLDPFSGYGTATEQCSQRTD